MFICFFCVFSKPTLPPADRPAFAHPHSVQTVLGLQQNQWCHDLCRCFWSVFLPGNNHLPKWQKVKNICITSKDKAEVWHTAHFDILGWLWRPSGLWEQRGVVSCRYRLLGHLQLQCACPRCVRPCLLPAPLDWPDCCLQLRGVQSNSLLDALAKNYA